MNDNTAIVIPARLESTRFPEKMLAQVTDEHCLIQRVEHWCKCATSHVYVATDSKKIASLFPNNHIMTNDTCINGTERVAEAALDSKLAFYDKIINVQGDMIDPPISVFDDIEKLLDYNNVVTVIAPMDDEDRMDPNTVKCIHNGYYAHWFCRAPLDYGDWHIGIYGYTKAALRQYDHLNIQRPELSESLEQLRWYENNFEKIAITYCTDDNIGEINTPEDLKNWKRKEKLNDT